MGRDLVVLELLRRLEYFNPRAPHGARRVPQGSVVRVVIISIHAPRMGRDAPKAKDAALIDLFQSTRPAWGATSKPVLWDFSMGFQSTRPAWGAT